MDTLIRHARVYDGTGSPWFKASVGIDAGRIRILRGDTSLVEAGRVIEADGLAVCPGFFDMHAHSTMVILGEPHHDAKVRQGVTTELIGVDGNSYAPFLDAEDLERWSIFNAGLDGEKPGGNELVLGRRVPQHVRRERGGKRRLRPRQHPAARGGGGMERSPTDH